MTMKQTQTPFEQGLTLAMKKCTKLMDSLELTRDIAVAGFTDVAYEQSFQAAAISEKLTMQIRNLPACMGISGATEEMAYQMKENIPVEMGFTKEGWFSVRLPALLPKKRAGGAAYIQSYLYAAFRDYFWGKPRVHHTEGCIIFRHVCDRKQPERQYRDHDNIEVKQVTDIVAAFVMVDDAPLLCPHYYCSTIGDDNRTEVYIVPQEEFANWLEKEKSFPDNGVTLYEKSPYEPKI